MLVFLFALILTVKCHDISDEGLSDWSLRQKLKAVEMSLLQYKHLSIFLNGSNLDKDVFHNDATKAERSYDNSRCIQDLVRIENSINNEKSKWGLAMLDAWGKLPSGDFTTDFGNYDQCRNMISTTNGSQYVQTQYCILEINMNQNLNFFKTQSQSLHLGICIPDSCAPKLIHALIDEYLNATNTIKTSIPPKLCQLRDDNTKIFPLDICLIAFLVSVLCIVTFSTVHDVIYDPDENDKNSLLVSFSAYSNGKKLFSCKPSKCTNDIKCLHGIRAISAQWIILLHFSSLFYNQNSLINNSAFQKFHTSHRAFITGAQFSVDTFFTLSGILVAIRILKELSDRNGQINLKTLYFHRYLRITPVLAVLVVFQMCLLKFFASGPNHQLIDSERCYCENGWWSALLYINIYFRGGCVLTSWYLSVDMHLFILAPFLLILLRRYEKPFIFISILVLLAYFIVALIGMHHFSNLTNGLYGTTYSRIPSWLIGVIFGYILFKFRSRNIQIPEYLNTFALSGSILLMAALVYGLSYFNDKTQYWYLWGGRSVWSISLCYIIFAGVHGYGGVVNWFLSLPQWQPLSRLSFITFLVHIMVIAVVKTNSKTGHFFSKFEFVQSFLTVSGITFVVAVILSLTIEMPIAALDQVYSSRKEQNMSVVLTKQPLHTLTTPQQTMESIQFIETGDK